MVDYKVFFSYQSDTKDNKEFIKKALLIADSKFEVQGIHLVIDEGMRDVAGNPNLFDVMLNKGSICDIFIADLTYVTKFRNSAGFEKSIPNPNVMLELGHAWNFHKNEHTIFILNNAYGESEDLPVDLKGFRFPINFTLEKNELDEKKTPIINELSRDLYKAISSSIRSINESKKTEFLPFDRFIFWNPISFDKYEFIKTEYFFYFKEKFEKLFLSKKSIIISGEKGSGKSRIVKESILVFCSEQVLNDIYYCNLSNSIIIEVTKKLSEINYKLQRPTTFIIDHCTESDMEIINNVIYGSNANCIFIISGKYNGDINIDKQTYISQLLSQLSSQLLSQNLNGNEILAKCGYDLKLILAELNNEESEMTTFQINSKFSLSQEQMRFVKYLSLFSKVGFDEHLKSEFNLFCDVFNLDKVKSSEIVADLLMKNLLVQKGGFIYFEADRIAEQYSYELWSIDGLSGFSISKLSASSNLINSFTNRQVEVQKKSTASRQFLLNCIKTELRDISILDTTYGNHFVYKLSEYYPTEILSSIEIVNKNFPNYSYSEFSGICWALERLYSKKTTFRRTANLLLQIYKSNTDKRDMISLLKKPFVSDDIDYNACFVLLEDFYRKGESDLVFDIYKESFKIEPLKTTVNKSTYLTNIIHSLISKRNDHKEKIDSIIVDIIQIACNLGLSKEIFVAVKLIIKENEVSKDIYIKLIHTRNSLSGVKFKNDRQKINRILTVINKKDIRNLLYGKVILSRIEWDKSLAERIQLMDDFVTELKTRENDDWLNKIDVLLRTGQSYNGNAIILGKVLIKYYSNIDAIINKCLELYKIIPIEEQSYGFIIGLLQSKIKRNNYSEFREFRDTLLEDSSLVHCGIAISNYLPTNVDDLHKVKDAIIKYDLPFKLINLSLIDFSKDDIGIIVTELIEYNKDASDISIIILDNAWRYYKTQRNNPTFNPTLILTKVIKLHNYWDPKNYQYDSAYSHFIDLLEETLRLFPNIAFAEEIISSIVNNCDGSNFNVNYSVNNLFKLLIENYQSIFLSGVEFLLNQEDISDSIKLRKLGDMLDYSNNADAGMYLTWCKKNGKKAAEFVAQFIPLFKPVDENNPQRWTAEALLLMDKYSEDSHVLNIISTKLYNGSVSIWRYQNNKNAYDSLSDVSNDTVRLWAMQEAEEMEQCIEKEKKSIELYEVWNK
jgi:hypothetical protein